MKRSLFALALFAAVSGAQEDPGVSYDADVVPLLRARCIGCHNPTDKEGGIDLSTRAGLMAELDGESIVTACNPDASLLIASVEPWDGNAPDMPAEGDPLSAEEIDLLRRWIAAGAREDAPPPTPIAEAPERYRAAPVIASLDFSRDGAWIAVPARHEVLLREAASGALARRLGGFPERVESLAFSPDGALLAAAGGSPGDRGELVIVRVADGELMQRLELTQDSLHGVSWSHDGRLVAFGAADRALRAIEVASGEQVLFQMSHEDWVTSTTFSSDDSHLISVSRDRSMKLIKVDTEQFIDNITSITPGALAGGLLDVALHPDPERDEVLVAGSDGEPKLYRVYREQKRVIGDDYNLIRAFPGAPGCAHAVAWAPSGERCFAAFSLRGAAAREAGVDGSGELRAYGIEGELAWSRPTPRALYALTVSPDGARVAAAGFDGRVHVYDAASGEPLTDFVPVPLLESAEPIAEVR